MERLKEKAGVRIQELTPEIAKSLGLDNEDGVLISMVNPGEPAEKGGLKSGDVILEFNGKKIKDVKSLQRTVAESAVESKAKVKVWRDKKTKSFTVKLGELEKFNTAENQKESNNKDIVSDEIEIDNIGLRLLGLNKETRARFNISKNITGVVVTAVKRDSFASKAGLSVGNVISQIAQKDIERPERQRKFLMTYLKKTESALLQVFEGEFSRFLIINIKVTSFVSFRNFNWWSNSDW